MHLRPFVNYILVLDGKSTDGTAEVADTIADTVISRDFSGSFAEEKNFARKQVPKDCEWLLWADADERFDHGFLGTLQERLTLAEALPIPVVCFRFSRINLPMKKSDSLEQILYTRLSECNLEVDRCPLKRLILKNLKENGKRLGEHINKQNQLKTKEDIRNYTLSGVITLIQELRNIVPPTKGNGGKPIKNVIENGIGNIMQRIERDFLNNEKYNTTKTEQKELKRINKNTERGTKKNIIKLTEIGEKDEGGKSLKNLGEDVKSAEKMIREFSKFIIENLQEIQKTGYERIFLLKNCSYCVLTAIGSHIMNTLPAKDWPDYQIRLIKNSRDIEWRGDVHEVPYFKPLDIPLTEIDQEMRTEKLGISTVEGFPIVHLARREDEQRSWW